LSEDKGRNIFSRIFWWILAIAGSVFLRLIYSTVRCREEGLENLSNARKLGPGRVVFVSWHARLLGSCYYHRNQGVCVMISRHRDGEIIAGIVGRLGFIPARGSATRGAAAALKAMLGTLGSGRDLALTVDGPRGPAGKVKPGAIYASSKSGCPLIPVSVGYSSKFVFSSWDRFQFPRPFCRMVVCYGTPMQIPGELDEDEIARWCLRVEKELNRTAALADNLARPVQRTGKLRVLPLLESFLTRERDHWYHLPLLAVLLPLEAVYRLLWQVREKLYALGILRSRSVPVPSVCVGSLALGGAGKTPVAMFLARRLSRMGVRVAVLTRGYGGLHSRSRKALIVHPGAASKENLNLLAQLVGDEAALVAWKLESVGLVVCSDRIRGAQTAVDKLGAQVLVMDDGFGHRRLARSMDLLLFTERLLHINTHLLPAGYFREPLAAAQRARAIVVDWSNGAESREPLLRWAQGKPVLSLRKSAAGVLPLDRWLSDPNEQNSALLPAETLKGKRVLAFCGIAHPESFRDLLAGYDPGLLELVAFQDHCVLAQGQRLGGDSGDHGKGCHQIGSGDNRCRVHGSYPQARGTPNRSIAAACR